MVFSHQKGGELAPDRLFKGKAEHYKFYMDLAILEINGLLKRTGSKMHVEFILNGSIEEIKKGLDEQIIHPKST